MSGLGTGQRDNPQNGLRRSQSPSQLRRSQSSPQLQRSQSSLELQSLYTAAIPVTVAEFIDIEEELRKENACLWKTVNGLEIERERSFHTVNQQQCLINHLGSCNQQLIERNTIQVGIIKKQAEEITKLRQQSEQYNKKVATLTRDSTQKADIIARQAREIAKLHREIEALKSQNHK